MDAIMGMKKIEATTLWGKGVVGVAYVLYAFVVIVLFLAILMAQSLAISLLAGKCNAAIANIAVIPFLVLVASYFMLAVMFIDSIKNKTLGRLLLLWLILGGVMFGGVVLGLCGFTETKLALLITFDLIAVWRYITFSRDRNRAG